RAAREHLPRVQVGAHQALVPRGVCCAQDDFPTVTDPVLGDGGLDGVAVPAGHIETRSYALADIQTIGLSSDGSFKRGDGYGTAAWEEAFREVEAEGPHKIGRYMSTKGTTATMLTDDRTYLGVRLK